MDEQLIGKSLGPYEIKDRLGEGGMGVVFHGYQPSMDRDVAVKVLRVVPAMDQQFATRFQQEARTIAKLEHARILPVYDYGEEEGYMYLVMRYLDSGTLRERIKERGALPPAEVNKVIKQVAIGLDYAHGRGFLHRDMTSNNVMFDSDGDAYITDFGLAKSMEDAAQLTGSAIIGTPAYISPEQAVGQDVDHRSDLYSLGVVLYEMLTGEVPFDAQTAMAIVVKHINEPMPDPREKNPNLTQDLADVLGKAMAKNPDERFQSAQELSDALSAAVAGSPLAFEVPTATQIDVSGKPGTTVVKREKQDAGVTIPRWLLYGISAVLLIIIVGIVALVGGEYFDFDGSHEAESAEGDESGGESVSISVINGSSSLVCAIFITETVGPPPNPEEHNKILGNPLAPEDKVTISDIAPGTYSFIADECRSEGGVPVVRPPVVDEFAGITVQLGQDVVWILGETLTIDGVVVETSDYVAEEAEGTFTIQYTNNLLGPACLVQITPEGGETQILSEAINKGTTEEASGLPFGVYQLKVSVCNADGTFRDEGVSVVDIEINDSPVIWLIGESIQVGDNDPQSALPLPSDGEAPPPPPQ